MIPRRGLARAERNLSVIKSHHQHDVMRRLCCCSGCTEKETRHDTKAGAGASEIAWRERNCTIRVQYSSSNTACSIRFPDRFEYDKSKNAVFECSIRTIRSGSNGYFIEYSIRCRIRMQYSNDKKWPYVMMMMLNITSYWWSTECSPKYLCGELPIAN
jgi:hypothetical protein